MENRIYRYVNIGILIRAKEEPGKPIHRYIDQLCFYSREKNQNKIYMIVEDGEIISRELPVDIIKKFEYAGIRNPFWCKEFGNYQKEGK